MLSFRLTLLLVTLALLPGPAWAVPVARDAGVADLPRPEGVAEPGRSTARPIDLYEDVFEDHGEFIEPEVEEIEETEGDGETVVDLPLDGIPPVTREAPKQIL